LRRLLPILLLAPAPCSFGSDGLVDRGVAFLPSWTFFPSTLPLLGHPGLSPGTRVSPQALPSELLLPRNAVSSSWRQQLRIESAGHLLFHFAFICCFILLLQGLDVDELGCLGGRGGGPVGAVFGPSQTEQR